MVNNIDRAKKIIRALISGSRVPEDALHAENVLEWVCRLAGNPDEAMIVAALAHDIERADEKRKIQRSDYDDYDDFKAAHAAASAEILEKILVRCRVDPCVVTRACSLVRMHETGGSPEADILRNADSLSFFEVNLPYYFKREGHDETFRRCVWGYARLSSELKRVCKDFSYSDPDLNRILSSVTAIHRSRHE